ncbi:MAG: SpoIIE family protein phosphatase [Chloroflexi bacterium]|nr:SpoIIE family protein phosphatase [Chloroflexota bacterium]
MRQVVEVTSESLSKYGEELCGDTVKINTTDTYLTVVLSDGLGSGVKANILSTLTAQIAGSMFEQGAEIQDVMQTLVDTLPECQVRKLAYATFAMVKVYRGHEVYLVEYDSPPLILVRNNEIIQVDTKERVVSGRKLREAKFEVYDKDYMVLVSDGYEHAGVGGIYRLGWGWQNIAIAVKRWAQTGCDAYSLTQALKRTCTKLYDGKPGDDATAVGMRVRPAIVVTILTGPPADKNNDELIVRKLMESPGQKVICGGTTAQMAARVLGKELKVDWVPPNQRVSSNSRRKHTPPTARLEGVDLVTEGILTLGQTVELLEKAHDIHELPTDEDASTRLARILLSADVITLVVGTAVNPNQVADVIRGEPMRMIYVRQLQQILAPTTKKVNLISI